MPTSRSGWTLIPNLASRTTVIWSMTCKHFWNPAVAALDESFFRVRFDRLTPAEKKYLRAMAELGPGPHRSGDIAGTLGREVTALGPTRNQLIAKGMIWSPHHVRKRLPTGRGLSMPRNSRGWRARLARPANMGNIC